MANKRAVSFGDFIYELRQQRGWSLRELADRSGISFGRLGEIERGEDAHSGKPFAPSYQSVLKLARAFAIPSDELLRMAGYEPGSDPRHQEWELVELFRSLPEDRREILLRKAKELAEELPNPDG